MIGKFRGKGCFLRCEIWPKHENRHREKVFLDFTCSRGGPSVRVNVQKKEEPFGSSSCINMNTNTPCLAQPHTAHKLVGGRISALPTRPVLNTVQFTSLLELQGSYDCTLPLLPDTFPLEDTRIFSHSLETSRRQFQIYSSVLCHF